MAATQTGTAKAAVSILLSEYGQTAHPFIVPPGMHVVRLVTENAGKHLQPLIREFADNLSTREGLAIVFNLPAL